MSFKVKKQNSPSELYTLEEYEANPYLSPDVDNDLKQCDALQKVIAEHNAKARGAK